VRNPELTSSLGNMQAAKELRPLISFVARAQQLPESNHKLSNGLE